MNETWSEDPCSTRNLAHAQEVDECDREDELVKACAINLAHAQDPPPSLGRVAGWLGAGVQDCVFPGNGIQLAH